MEQSFTREALDRMNLSTRSPSESLVYAPDSPRYSDESCEVPPTSPAYVPESSAPASPAYVDDDDVHSFYIPASPSCHSLSEPDNAPSELNLGVSALAQNLAIPEYIPEVAGYTHDACFSDIPDSLEAYRCKLIEHASPRFTVPQDNNSENTETCNELHVLRDLHAESAKIMRRFKTFENTLLQDKQVKRKTVRQLGHKLRKARETYESLAKQLLKPINSKRRRYQ